MEAAADADVRIDGRLAWPHLLRHTAGTVAYERTLDPLRVAGNLGHKDIRQIKLYMGRSDKRKRRVTTAAEL